MRYIDDGCRCRQHVHAAVNEVQLLYIDVYTILQVTSTKAGQGSAELRNLRRKLRRIDSLGGSAVVVCDVSGSAGSLRLTNFAGASGGATRRRSIRLVFVGEVVDDACYERERRQNPAYPRKSFDGRQDAALLVPAPAPPYIPPIVLGTSIISLSATTP